MPLCPEDFDPECCPVYREHVWLFRDSYAGGYRSYLCDGCGCSGFMRSDGQNRIELILECDVRGGGVAHLHHHLHAADATTADVYCWECHRILASEEAAEAWPAPHRELDDASIFLQRALTYRYGIWGLACNELKNRDRLHGDILYDDAKPSCSRGDRGTLSFKDALRERCLSWAQLLIDV